MISIQKALLLLQMAVSFTPLGHIIQQSLLSFSLSLSPFKASSSNTELPIQERERLSCAYTRIHKAVSHILGEEERELAFPSGSLNLLCWGEIGGGERERRRSKATGFNLGKYKQAEWMDRWMALLVRVATRFSWEPFSVNHDSMFLHAW